MGKNYKKIVFGIILIVVAALLIMKGMNPGFMSNVFGSLGVWEIVWTVILLIILISAIMDKQLFMIILSIAFLLFIYKGKFGIPFIPAWAIFVPAGLLYIGIESLIPKRWHVHKNSDGNGFHFEYRSDRDDDDEDDDPKIVECNGNKVEVSFSSAVKYFDSEDFRSSKLECNFGSIKAYYDKVKMAGTDAYINAEENFGSIEIYVPKAWKCEVDKSSAFGSVKDRGSSDWDGEHTVHMKLEANFGEIVIYHV